MTRVALASAVIGVGVAYGVLGEIDQQLGAKAMDIRAVPRGSVVEHVRQLRLHRDGLNYDQNSAARRRVKRANQPLGDLKHKWLERRRGGPKLTFTPRPKGNMHRARADGDGDATRTTLPVKSELANTVHSETDSVKSFTTDSESTVYPSDSDDWSENMVEQQDRAAVDRRFTPDFDSAPTHHEISAGLDLSSSRFRSAVSRLATGFRNAVQDQNQHESYKQLQTDIAGRYNTRPLLSRLADVLVEKTASAPAAVHQTETDGNKDQKKYLNKGLHLGSQVMVTELKTAHKELSYLRCTLRDRFFDREGRPCWNAHCPTAPGVSSEGNNNSPDKIFQILESKLVDLGEGERTFDIDEAGAVTEGLPADPSQNIDEWAMGASEDGDTDEAVTFWAEPELSSFRRAAWSVSSTGARWASWIAAAARTKVDANNVTDDAASQKEDRFHEQLQTDIASGYKPPSSLWNTVSEYKSRIFSGARVVEGSGAWDAVASDLHVDALELRPGMLVKVQGLRTIHTELNGQHCTILVKSFDKQDQPVWKAHCPNAPSTATHVRNLGQDNESRYTVPNPEDKIFKIREEKLSVVDGSVQSEQQIQNLIENERRKTFPSEGRNKLPGTLVELQGMRVHKGLDWQQCTLLMAKRDPHGNPLYWKAYCPNAPAIQTDGRTQGEDHIFNLREYNMVYKGEPKRTFWEGQKVFAIKAGNRYLNQVCTLESKIVAFGILSTRWWKVNCSGVTTGEQHFTVSEADMIPLSN